MGILAEPATGDRTPASVPAAGSPGPSRRQAPFWASIDVHLVLLGAVILLGQALRLHDLGSKSLWGDEINTARLFVRMPLAYIATHLHSNNHTLYTLLAHLLTPLGNNDFLLRVPAALLGIAAVPAIYAVGRTAFNPTTGLVAAFALAISPDHLWYSQDARGYTGMAFFSLLSIFFLIGAIRTEKEKYKAGFVLSSVLAIYTHLFSAITVLAEMCVLVAYEVARALRRRRTREGGSAKLRTWAFSLLCLGLLLALLYAPLWLAWLSLLPASYAGDYLGPMGYPTNWKLDALSMLRLLQTFAGARDGRPQLLSGMSVTFAVLGVIFGLVQRRSNTVTLIAILGLPFALIAAIKALWTSFYVYSRFFISLLPLFLIFVAYGITSVARLVALRVRLRPDRVGPVSSASCWLMTGLLGVAAIAPIRQVYTTQKDDWKGAAAVIYSNLQPGDLVVGLHWADQCLKFYAPKLPVQRLVDESQAELDRLYAEHPRLWYVRTWSRSQQRPELEAWVQERAFFTLRFPNIMVSLGSREGAIGEGEQRKLLAGQSTPLDAAGVLQQADLLMDRELVEEAVGWYERAVALDPDWGLAHTRLGNAYRALSRLDEAEASYRRSIEVEPGYLGAYINLAGVLFARQQYEEALALYRQAVDIAPDSAWAHSALGTASLQLGDTEDAMEHLQRAVVLEPDNVTWLLALADGYRKLGQVEKAISAYQQVLSMQPGNWRASEALRALAP